MPARRVATKPRPVGFVMSKNPFGIYPLLRESIDPTGTGRVLRRSCSMRRWFGDIFNTMKRAVVRDRLNSPRGGGRVAVHTNRYITLASRRGNGP